MAIPTLRNGLPIDHLSGGDLGRGSSQSFPRKPFLDRVIVRVTPLEELFEQGAVTVPLESSHIKVKSDRGIVVSVGDCVVMGAAVLPMPVNVGDEVYFDDMAYAGRIYLEPHDQYKSDLPTYLEIRVGDLLGRKVTEPNTVTFYYADATTTPEQQAELAEVFDKVDASA